MHQKSITANYNMNWAAVPPANSAAALSVLSAEDSAYTLFHNKMTHRLYNKNQSRLIPKNLSSLESSSTKELSAPEHSGFLHSIRDSPSYSQHCA
jgi:hypothetical protein